MMLRTTGKPTLAVVLAAALTATVPPAAALEGLRGSSWGEVRWDLPEEGTDNLLTNAWIRQGADWKRWGHSTLNTYATLRLKADTEKLAWNNAIGPGIGIALDTYTDRGLSASWGVEYLWDRYFEADPGVTEKKAVIYMNWYGAWDLRRGR